MKFMSFLLVINQKIVLEILVIIHFLNQGKAIFVVFNCWGCITPLLMLFVFGLKALLTFLTLILNGQCY